MSTIFVIEDDSSIARLVEKLLSKRGHAVETFYTGEAGLLKILAARPDLVLMDLGLPDIDGQTVVAIIRQQPHLALMPIIAFTAWPTDVAVKTAKAYGCDGVVTKPIDTRQFVNQVEQFLEKSFAGKEGNSP